MKRKLLMLLLCCFTLFSAAIAQNTLIKGVIQDSSGEPIIGASVTINETTLGTISDVDGKYELMIPDSDVVLSYSYVGYTTQEVAANGRTVINVTLESSDLGIDEVVVVGYGTQRKTDVTSAVASIKSDDFASVVTSSSPLQMVQGKIPGLAISKSGGSDPTSDVSMQVRGMNSINGGSSPLIVINGIPGGSLATVSPNDIESIDVLRDGSAAAIYGSRGTAGVIIVTTKNASVGGGIKVEYDASFSYDQIYNEWDLMSADQWRELKTTLSNSSSELAQAKAALMTDYGGDTNWMDEITDNSFSQQHYLSLSGSSEHFSTLASLTYNDYNGVVNKTFKEEINGRIQTEFRHFDDMLKVNLNLAYTAKTQSPSQSLALKNALIWNPTLSVYQEDGSYTDPTDPLIYMNPVNLVEEEDEINKYNTLIADAKISLTPIEGLTLSAFLSLNRTESNLAYYKTSENDEMVNLGYTGQAYRKYALNDTRTFEFTATYNKQLTNKLSMDLLGGYSYQEFNNESFNMTNYNFTFDETSYNDIGSGSALKDGNATMASYKAESKLISFFGRAVFNYDNRFLFNATVRREGSSRFGLNNQWGTFPAFSGAWRIINEDFMENQTIFDDLKLRVGYGVTGNMLEQNYINYVLFEAQNIYAHDGTTNGSYDVTYSPSSNANPDIKWETKKEWNFGVDMAFLDNRLTANVDLYNRKSEDLLYKYNVSVPPYLDDELWGNIGTISNRGIEVGISATPILKKDFSWDLYVNGSYNRNNVDKLTTSSGDVQESYEYNIASPLNGHYVFVTKVGEPIGNFWGFKYAGVNESGETMVYVLNEDKSISYDENGNAETIRWADTKGSETNKTVIGNGMPQYYLNFGSTFRYKQFDFSFQLRGVFGFEILNLGSTYLGTPTFNRTENALVSAMTSEIYDEPSITDAIVEKGDYVKLDNISIGYNIPFNKTKHKGNIRIYGTVQNICTFTGYSGRDPELEIDGTQVGCDAMDAYPISRTYSLGVKFSF